MIKTALRAVALTTALVALSACESVSEKKDPLKGDVVDETDLSGLLLTAGDPNDAIAYFEKALAREPDRADFRRGLALSYVRAKRYPEAARVYQELRTLGQSTSSDDLEYAFVAMRLENWDDVAALSNGFSSGFNTPRRHLLDAMLADHAQDWESADAAYERATKLSTSPAGIYNNWGVSKMSRGDLAAATQKFERAISFDSRLFAAKNNLAIARGLQGNFDVPVVPLTDSERALILNNLGLIALRKGERKMALGLFAAAVDAHPQHYQTAADRLAALEAKVAN